MSYIMGQSITTTQLKVIVIHGLISFSSSTMFLYKQQTTWFPQTQYPILFLYLTVGAVFFVLKASPTFVHA